MRKIVRLAKWLLGLLIVIGIVWVLWITYQTGNTGFNGKTLWDWMELLIVPVVLAIGIWWLNKTEKETEREIAGQRVETERQIALDRQQQNALEAYFDRMTNLLLEKGLRNSEEGAEVRSIARTQTLTVLRQLDPPRRGQVLRFLFESGLIMKNRIVDLNSADFSQIELPSIDLSGADLSGVRMVKANLSRAELRDTIFSEADLSNARLVDAWLTNAYLSGATLVEADLTFAKMDKTNLYQANLRKANLRKASLEQATLNKADLSYAILRGAKLDDASLGGADFSNADFRGIIDADEVELKRAGIIGPFRTHELLRAAQVTREQLETAESLQNAILPDGTIHRS